MTFFVAFAFFCALLVSFFGKKDGMAWTHYFTALLAQLVLFVISITTNWIPVSFLGVDGFSFLFLVLVFLLPFIISLSQRNLVIAKPNLYYGLFLCIQAALIGLFSAQTSLLFFVFWELALLPTFFLFWGWGSPEKRKHLFRYVIFSFLGSFLMLFSILTLFFHSQYSFDFSFFDHLHLPVTILIPILITLILSVFIKLPIFPFHFWQPGVYTESDFGTSMWLGAILSKMGIFALYRLVLPLIAVGSLGTFLYPFLLISGVSAVLGALFALGQSRFKSLIAYSSLSHMGIMGVAMLSGSVTAFHGIAVQLFSHAIVVVGLFLVCQILVSRFATDEFARLGGIRRQSVFLAVSFFVIVLAGIGFPLTSGFVGEFLMLLGIFEVHPMLALVCLLTVVLGAWYLLRAFGALMLGPVVRPEISIVLSRTEKWALGLIVSSILVLGVFSDPIIRWVELSESLTTTSSAPAKEGTL